MRTLSLVRSVFLLLSIVCFAACNAKIERSGVVIDKQTRQPLSNVMVEVYLGHLQGDSLHAPVFTDSVGYFHVTEKRADDRLFQLSKEGYIGFVIALKTPGDTLELERTEE